MSAQPRSPASPPVGKTKPPARRPVAVALKYELGTETLPRIVATGKGTVAEQILEVAFANGVKVREDADLVEILSAIEVDSDIPVEAIAAVAEVLAYVYRANGTLPPEPRAEELPEDKP
ncbi:flagellar protein FhlB [Azospirillum sp. 412522]|nr:EscU/YscU/HrcU family type III secretion system export apparatus switch protein [Azospirillum sp. 412522]MBY6261594.1 flagellar protein FhlB [Azospirillum sp. 412522]